jgi:anaerobic selenocysteine-containing dehydrogenase
MPMTEFRRAVCPHDCPDSCSVRIGVAGDRAVSLAGDADHPITRGFLCGKVNRYLERVYSPLRIQTPLRRVGRKGEGRFEPIGWDEALAEIAARFRDVIAAHGPQAILPYSYGGTIGRVQMYAGHRFFHALGASRLARTICTGSAIEGQRMTTGVMAASDLEKIARSRLILLWGINAVATHIHVMPLVREARRNGAQVVAIDTYRTATARQADRFLCVRPGTDAALALGMIRLILRERLHDPDFVERYTIGLDALREAAEAYTPERVEALTGVPATDVEWLARQYGSEKASFIRLGGGPSRHGNGGMTVRTISCLPCLTGAWDDPGGGFLCFGFAGGYFNRESLESPHPEDPPARTVNMVRLGEALTRLDDPPVKALYVYNSNPAAIAPEQALVHRGLAREDLFLAVHEQVLTDTTDFADIVLPATTFLEHDDLMVGYGHPYVQLSRAAIPPVGQAKSNLEVFSLLATRMGMSAARLHEPFDSIVAGLLDVPNGPVGAIDREALQAGKPVKLDLPEAPWRNGGLRTPSRKFEFYSAKAAERGLPPVPAFMPSEEGHLENERKARFPLQFVSPPAQQFLNTSFGDTVTSRRLEGRPTLKLHPRDATRRGLADGEPCRAYNDRGQCYLTVEVTEDVPPGVTVSEGIWWPKLLHGRLGTNSLTSAELTDLGGCARFHDCLVEVEKAH